MKFLRMEVKVLRDSLMLAKVLVSQLKRNLPKIERRLVHTMVYPQQLDCLPGLLAGNKGVCVFCDKSHDSQTCVSAQTMSYGLKKKKDYGQEGLSKLFEDWAHG